MAAILDFLKIQIFLKLNKRLIENVKNVSNLLKLSIWIEKTRK